MFYVCSIIIVVQFLVGSNGLWGHLYVTVILCLMHCVCFVQTVHHNAYHQDPYAKEFGIKISEKLAQVEARILPAPWVFYLKTVLPLFH